MELLYDESQITDPTFRTKIKNELKGIIWKMHLIPVNEFFALLKHKRFKNPVYFPYKKLGIENLDNIYTWRVEVDVQYDKSKNQYGYVACRVCEYDCRQPSSSDIVALPSPAEVNCPSCKNHLIFEMKPSSVWNIFIDETGDYFKNDKTKHEKQLLGKMVALLLPGINSLPELPSGWHAVEHKGQVPMVISRLKDTDCGILGLSVNELASLKGDLWDICLRTLIDLILRLLPVSGPTILKVFVEEHSSNKISGTYSLEQTFKDALLQLAKILPDKAKYITVEAQVISKKDNFLNGYVDAIAFCWGSPNKKANAEIAGWIEKCLWENGSKRIIDILTGPELPSEMDWNDLIREYSDNPSNVYIASYLKILSRQIASTPGTWEKYLALTREHLESKAINQKLLHAQIKWLRQAMPEYVAFTPQIQLILMTSELAEANHVGKILNEDFLYEFVPLCDDLVDENAPLVAWADLNLSVAYTNAFDFEGARNVIERWKNVKPGHPGRQYYGQILSTQGQLSAFLGRQDEAIEFFDRAIDFLVQNSDPDKGELDRLQTMAYKLIALMDAPDSSKIDLDKAFDDYFGMDPLRAAVCQAVSMDNPYAQHVFLRLMQTGLYKDAKEAYLSKREQWECGAYHPWELIEFYRGLICETDEERLSHLQKGYEIAMNGDLTMNVIGAVILGSILLFDASRNNDYLELVRKIADKLPKLGERRIILEEQPIKCYSPLELAKLVLPFNFR